MTFFDFNPRSPCGERRCGRIDSCTHPRYFNPRSPCGERPLTYRDEALPEEFQSTLPVWGATRFTGSGSLEVVEFQSTLPVWGATLSVRRRPSRRRYFNPRSPCGERHVRQYSGPEQLCISIHAPRVGSDCPANVYRHADGDFNPRSPCGERPHALQGFLLLRLISIHAPRVGSDGMSFISARETRLFQSTLPVWGATGCRWRFSSSAHNFNPRSPCGERLGFPRPGLPADEISIHAPRVGSDDEIIRERWGIEVISIHAPRVGSDQSKPSN